MKYVILSTHDTDCAAAEKRLEKLVEDYLVKGWQLVGGVSLSVSPNTEMDYKEYHLAQALTWIP